MLIAGIGRCWDYQNWNQVKHHCHTQEVKSQLYRRFGILNMFSPKEPNGCYTLDLSIFEEKTVAKMLVELARQEGLQFMSEVKLGSKSYDKLTGEVIKLMAD